MEFLKNEYKKLLVLLGIFLVCFYLPVGWARFDNAVMESLHLVKWYAQEHVILCLVPAFFIAGAVGVFVSQASVMKYLGAKANKVLAYGVAAVSGCILAVCSCTILPLFAGIYRMGAGLGPASTFLYSGPAINILAIILTARILGFELGAARAIGAVVFSVIIGLCMHFIFRREELDKANAQVDMPEVEGGRPLWQTALYFAAMVGILVFANWGKPQDVSLTLSSGEVVLGTIEQQDETNLILLPENVDTDTPGRIIPLAQIERTEYAPGVWTSIFSNKWYIAAGFAVLLGAILALWYGVAAWKLVALGAVVALFAVLFPQNQNLVFSLAFVGFSLVLLSADEHMKEWFNSTWTFAKLIMPLLFIGVVVAGLLLGRVGNEGLIPSEWISGAVGGNSLWANLFASVAGAFMYFATLTEVPILQGLIGAGMGKGPALALLLAGPALSLPNMLVIRGVMGTKKTVVFVSLVVVMATISGLVFGALA